MYVFMFQHQWFWERPHLCTCLFSQETTIYRKHKLTRVSSFLLIYPILSTISWRVTDNDRKMFLRPPQHTVFPPSRPSRPWPQVWVPQWWRCFSEAPGLLGESLGEPYEVISKWSLYIYIFIYIYMMDVSENNGSPPNHPILIGVFQYFHHPFWGAPIVGNTVL